MLAVRRCWWCGRAAEVDTDQQESNGLLRDDSTMDGSESWICSSPEPCVRAGHCQRPQCPGVTMSGQRAAVTMEQLFAVSAQDVADTNDEWYTPRWIFDAAGLVFDVDVCAPVAPEFRTCPARRYLTVLDDGVTAPWDGLAWMNPPYSNAWPWIERFASHPDGLALLPAAKSSWRGLLMRSADGIALISVGTRQGEPGSRLRTSTGFGRPDGSHVNYPVALILAARGELAISALGPVAAADPYAGGAYHVRPV